jgi:hypothetical protein
LENHFACGGKHEHDAGRHSGTYINVLCYSKKACLPAAEPKTVYEGTKHVE